jgi:hypothetical protein
MSHKNSPQCDMSMVCTPDITLVLPFLQGCAIPQVGVTSYSLQAPEFDPWGRPCGINDRQSGTNIVFYLNTVHLKSRCALTKGVGSDVYKHLLGLNLFNYITLFTGIALNRCLTTEYSETTAHFNGNFDTDNQIYGPYPKCTVTFRTHCTLVYPCYYHSINVLYLDSSITVP